MKKLGLVYLGILLAFCVVYTVWIQFPKIQDPRRLQEVEVSAQEHFVEIQTVAKDPERNGYLSQTFLPYWGRKGVERKENAPIKKILEDWNGYSTSSTREFVDHSSLAKNSSYQAALSKFETVAPELEAAMRKPVFAAPDQELSFNSPVMNFISVRSSAQAMVGYAEARAAQGKILEAASATVAVMEFGKAVETQTTLINEMVGVAVQSIGFDGYVGLLGPESKLSAAQWKALAGRLTDALPVEQELATTMGSEMVGFQKSVAMLKTGKFPDLNSAWWRLPGFLSREARIYSNLMLTIDSDLRDGGTVQMPSYLANPSTSDYLTGKVGNLALVVLPNYVRADAEIRFNRTKIAGAATATAVLAFRAENRRLPKNLDEIRAAGIPIPHSEVLKEVEAVYALSGTKATLSLPFDGTAIGNPTSQDFAYGPREWFGIQNDTILFRF